LVNEPTDDSFVFCFFLELSLGVRFLFLLGSTLRFFVFFWVAPDGGVYRFLDFRSASRFALSNFFICAAVLCAGMVTVDLT
jgi:hypothetical protein